MMMRNLAFGAALTIAFLISFSCDLSSRERSGAEHAWQAGPPLPYCELANNPDKYNGQRVRVVTTLYFMMHGYKFLDKDCPEKETAVLLDAAVEMNLARETGTDEYNPWSFPKVIALGKFSRATPGRKSDSIADNSEMIFETDDVESVIK